MPNSPPSMALEGAIGMDLIDGWEAAKNWRRLQDQLAPRHRRRVQEAAIDAILQRARQLLRHGTRPLQAKEMAWPEEGELDLDRTLDAGFLGTRSLLQPQDLRLSRTMPREAEVVAILDMSLSMTGEKIALIALSVAILRCKLDQLAVIAFDTQARPLLRMGEQVSLREMVRRILNVPAQGYTNIEAGLEMGLRELRRSRARERAGLLLSDGVANMGRNPSLLAPHYPRLHVVHLGDHHPQGARCCKEMAQLGRGHLYRAYTYADLPKIIRNAMRELFRR